MNVAKVGAGVLGTILVLSTLSKWTAQDSQQYSPQFVKKIKLLVRNAAQWSTVSRQDENALVALMHINYAVAYARMAKRLVPSREVERIANVNLDELLDLLEDQQLAAIQRIHQLCPSLQPEGVFAVSTGWLA